MIRLELKLDLAYDVLDAQGVDFVFNIHAAQTPRQIVAKESLEISRDLAAPVVTDPHSAARIMRMHAPPGPLRLAYRATVDLAHHTADPQTLAEVPVAALPLDVLQYLYPSRYCQSDRLLTFAGREFGALPQGYGRVLAIQKWVQNHVTFTSNVSNSNTSAVDTLVERVGVCRDFAHLMIALCRAVNIPARMATGTDYGSDPALGPPDLHAYVEAWLGDRWYIFDASGTSIPMGFIRFGTGRDAADVAFATIFGAVASSAPVISTRVHTGGAQGFIAPRHSPLALSTAA